MSVTLISSMGDDLMVARAAWVSTQRDQRDASPAAVEKLIRFLLANRPAHASPLGHPHVTVMVECPIFVSREWMRHRVQCLTGDTIISCLSPKGMGYTRTIKQIYDLKHGGVVDRMPVKNGFSKAGTQVYRENSKRFKNPERRRILPNCQERTLRVLDESTGFMSAGRMQEVWETGVKEVYEVAREDGRSLRVSATHPFYTRDGWVEAKYLRADSLVSTPKLTNAEMIPCPPRLRQGIGIWVAMMRRRLIQDEGVCYLCGQAFKEADLELDHVIPVVVDLAKALDVTNLKPACVPCHRAKSSSEQQFAHRKIRYGSAWVRLSRRPIIVGEEQTYDITMDGPHHNYVANGLVVHNTFSEVSSRYSDMSGEAYLPLLEDFRTQVGKPGEYHMEPMEDADARLAQVLMKNAYEQSAGHYQALLRGGVAREVARNVLPLGTMTRFYATASLRNWLAFLILRDHPSALLEIRREAAAVKAILTDLFPIVMQVWEAEGRPSL